VVRPGDDEIGRLSMTTWNWNGARWWKFDFHSHTPASEDYGKGPDQNLLKQRTAHEWLLDYMKAGIDCVAITDHNSGAWIDILKHAYNQLVEEKPEGFRTIYLFPGVEISVNGGIHVLAIFGNEKTTADIDSLLGAIHFRGTRGTSNAVTEKSLIEVVNEITTRGGIAIPAHVDEPHGLFTLNGQTLQQILQCKDIFAIELLNPSLARPQIFIDLRPSWVEVLGSDSHHPSGAPDKKYAGSHYTWIKMGEPCIEGLQLALLDGPLSVLRSDSTNQDPNKHADLVIESIEVSNSRYIGRAKDFVLHFNPWMNAIIGGRGTGKSTLIEFIRLSLRRDKELPELLQSEFQKYAQVYENRNDKGLLTKETVLRVTYQKNGISYRTQWDSEGHLDPIQEWVNNDWQRSEGDIQQRFPVRIYSQKQIYQMASTPLALLKIIDDAPEVNYAYFKSELNKEENQYLSVRAKIREIETGLLEESRLKGELADVKRRLAIFEESGHAETFRALQKRRRQLNTIETWESSLVGSSSQLREIAEKIKPEDLDTTSFDQTDSADTQFLELINRTMQAFDAIALEVKTLADKIDDMVVKYQRGKDSSAWKMATDKANQDYEDLLLRLQGQGVTDPSEYGILVQQRQTIELKLKDLEGRKEQIQQLERQATECLDRILTLRRQITEKRQQFLTRVLKNNSFVRISIIPYGAKEIVETEFRQLIQRDSGGFERDIGTPDGQGLLGNLYNNDLDSAAIEKRLAVLKKEIRSIALKQQNAQIMDKRFSDHIARLPPEALDRLDLWFPEDSLHVEYSTSGDNHIFRPIQEGSPGQKTAALLAFLLSYGEEPLILDQPEDDLDNHLIYDLIVTQLREVKMHRQVIVVSHNANIVVNGDAELVIALVARAGQTQTEAIGCLQEKATRQAICQIMEGGETAFEQRYRRIALEGRYV